ncbi:hypothetical protein ACFYT4_27530 [Streptomyces sp. NPDC004609]|uniref:hypothetical protein n=1 Tax=Streptomyces sp. NPDC004609 TaxID=3364704 RepID=UPI0036801A00
MTDSSPGPGSTGDPRDPDGRKDPGARRDGHDPGHPRDPAAPGLPAAPGGRGTPGALRAPGAPGDAPPGGHRSGRPRWVTALTIGASALLALLLVAHLSGGGAGGH